MRRAIEETDRRRAKQVEFNTKRGITPIGISKQVRDMIEGARDIENVGLQLKAAQEQATGGMPPFVADSVGTAVRDGLDVYGTARFHPWRRGALQSCRGAGPAPQQYRHVHADLCGSRRAELIGFFAINVHWIDIGGCVPHSTDIFMEGLQLRSIKLMSKGEPIEEVYRIIENNTRQPVELMGDIAAQLAGCLLGAT